MIAPTDIDAAIRLIGQYEPPSELVEYKVLCRLRWQRITGRNERVEHVPAHPPRCPYLHRPQRPLGDNPPGHRELKGQYGQSSSTFNLFPWNARYAWGRAEVPMSPWNATELRLRYNPLR